MNAKKRIATAVTIALFGIAAFGAPGGKPGKPVDESAGNNLSFPVIWSEGVAKALRGDFDNPVFYTGECDAEAPCIEIEGVPYYYQQASENEWQAEWLNAVTGASNNSEAPMVPWAPLYVDEIDWGDNLEARSWNVNSVVRVETVLYQDVTDAPMLGYEMMYLFGDGPNEMQGTNTVTYDSPEATLYSGCARLTIQKLTKPRDDATLEVEWDSAAGEWTGDVEEAVLNSGVWEGAEGSVSPNVFSAEINVGGKVIYGFNWRVRKLDPQPTGDWRLTFSLDDPDYFGLEGHCDVELNTYFDDITAIRVPEPEDLADYLPAFRGLDMPTAEPEPSGGVAVVDWENNLTYIDVRIEPSNSKGGKGKP